MISKIFKSLVSKFRRLAKIAESEKPMVAPDRLQNVVSALEEKAEEADQSVNNIDGLLAAFAEEEEPIDPEDKWMVANYVFDLLAQMRESEKKAEAYREAAEMIKNEISPDGDL